MGTLNLGRVRGSMWYAGTGITGTSTTGTVFPASGVTTAYEGDMYLNTAAASEHTGNIYRCVLSGNADTAKWVYAGGLKVQADLVNNLVSTATDKGLTANQGRVLREMIENTGFLPLSVLPKISVKAYSASVTVRNENAVITVITVDGETGQYSVTASGSTSTRTVVFTVGTDIGLSENGAIVQEIRSTSPISDYSLYDNDSAVIASDVPDLWTRINEAEENVRTGANITDGEEITKGGILSKIVDGVRNVLWPITHAKAVWFDKTNNRTVHDVIGTEDMGTDANTLTGAIAERGEDIRTLSSSLSPNISTLSVYQNRVTILGGGFIKVGRIVVVDVYVRAGLSTYGGGSILTGAPACAGTNAISAYLNNGSVQTPMGAHVTASGIITISSPSGVDVQNKEIYIAGAYIANS